MKLSTYHDIVYQIINTNSPGYGYVDVFMNALYSHRGELNIGNAVLYLRIDVNGCCKEWLSFADNRKINTESFRLHEMATEDRVIDSRREDINAYKNSLEFGNFHVIAFPIHPPLSKEKLMDVKALVLLLSYNPISISVDEQELLYKVLGTQRPKTMGCPQVSKAIKCLVSTEGKMSGISLKDRHVILAKALDVLAAKGDDRYNQNGLRHFSFWSSNNIEKRNLCKEFNKNTYGDFLHDITHKVLDGQRHFVVDYFNFYKEHEDRPFTEVIKLFNYEDIESSLNNSDKYFPRIGLTKDNTSVVVIPLRFDSHISFCCFYIKDIFFTPFVSITLFKKFGEAIRQRINLINEINIKNMLDEMMAASSKYTKSTDCFKEISTILKKSNEAEECLIYLQDDSDERFLLSSEEDENFTSTIHESNILFADHEFFLPGQYAMSSFIRQNLFYALETGNSVCSYPENSGVITSACVIVIKNSEKKTCGFILLINKRHETQNPGLFFNNLFFHNNIYITESCSKYLTLYLNTLHSDNRKVRLLKKLRHEIPDCTHVIDRNIREMIAKIENRGYRIERFPRKSKEIILNNRRIDNIASFFSTIDFDDRRFLDNPEPFNMRDYMNERLEIYREEAAYRGVYIRCNTEIDTPTLNVSDYYLHAVNNIITNAIRYSAPGTSIWIRSDSDMITVSDIGIQITDTEINKIFKEGYRSVAAKDINQRGMGYGLYLVKRILDAYGHPISVHCDNVYERNIFAERMVSEIISSFSPEERHEYVLQDTLPQERDKIWEKVRTIKESDSLIPTQYRSFANRDVDCYKFWLAYSRNFGLTFRGMIEDIFNKPVFNVTFSVRISK